MKVTVMYNELKAAVISASTDESRYCLNGVQVECAKGKRPVLVSTDGRRITVISSLGEECEEKGSFILSNEGLGLLFAAVEKRQARTNTVEVGIEFTPRSTLVTFTALGMRLGDKCIIEATYPNWKQLFKDKSAPEKHAPFTMNGRFVADFRQQCELLADGREHSIVFHNWELNGVAVRCSNNERITGIIMPIQLNPTSDQKAVADPVPAWLLEP